MAKTTYDLTNLGLAAGTHSITVRAKADGYADSEPSNAVEYVVEESVPTDLTGYTVTVPANWSATAGFGFYNLEGTVTRDAGSTVPLALVGGFSFRIGYSSGTIFSAREDYLVYSYVSNNTGDIRSVNSTPDFSFVFNFTGGTDVSNPTLIQWFVDNNATFEKTA